MEVPRRTIIIAFVVGLEILAFVLCMRWDPYNAGIIEKDGIIYELPRADDPAEYNTRYFDKAQFETTTGNQKRVLTYYLHAPEHIASGQKYPLVIVLHGRPGRAYAAEYLVTTEMERDFPSFVLVPTSPESKAWAVPEKKDSPYAGFVSRQSLPDVIDILRRLIQDHPVDKNRIYIVGCSEGGIGAFGAVLRYPDVFAAAVPISGTWDIDEASQMIKVPMWVEHGAQDPDLPVTTIRAIVESIKTHGGSVQYSELPDLGHYCPSSQLYGRDMWEWLFRQAKH